MEPRELVDVLYFDVLKVRLDGTLGNLVWWLVTAHSRGVETLLL